MSYIVVIDSHSDILDDFSKEYPCTKENSKFVEPRILRMWKDKAKYIYRKYDNTSVCDVLVGGKGE